MSDRANSKTVAHIAVMRTPLGRARGLGAAKSGSGRWWTERVTSVALVPLTVWFIWHVVGSAGAPHAAMVAWMQSPVNLVLMLCLVLATFHHMNLGLQVVVEDYIHSEPAHVLSLLAIQGIAVLLALASIVSILKLGLSTGQI